MQYNCEKMNNEFVKEIQGTTKTNFIAKKEHQLFAKCYITA